MGTRPPAREWNRVHSAPRQWSSVVLRPGDIVISTPPKSGTTLTQGVVSSLLWPEGDAPADLWAISPWIDLRFNDDSTFADLAAQTHRRFVKSHTPADALPFDDRCRYITVDRDLRDVLMSWANHRASMHAFAIEALNDMSAADGVPPLDPNWDGDLDQLFDELMTEFNPLEHVQSWWDLRDEPNVLHVHFNDLRADLEGEMRRIAEFLDIDVPERSWPRVVDRCSLDAMREAGQAIEAIGMGFEGGADAFFHQGTNRRWEGALTDDLSARIDEALSTLPPEAAAWLEHGSIATGDRP
jgi:aryl sulfotransferase